MRCLSEEGVRGRNEKRRRGRGRRTESVPLLTGRKGGGRGGAGRGDGRERRRQGGEGS